MAKPEKEQGGGHAQSRTDKQDIQAEPVANIT
jgi:hypothetical protein